MDSKAKSKSATHYQTLTSAKRILFKDFIHVSTRLKSFQTWQNHKAPIPNKIAQAGFFYLGVSDKVCCYYCGIVLHDWKPHNDPFIEHTLFSPSCPFVHVNRIRFSSFFLELPESNKTIMVNW